MTEYEAIEIIKHYFPRKKVLDGMTFVEVKDRDSALGCALEEALCALYEIKQYREIGTVEEIKKAISILSLSDDDIITKDFHELYEYRKIGTVEECREAREKQTPKAPKDSLKIEPIIDESGAYVDADTTVYILCPNCGELVGIDEDIDRFCRECGQAIQWNENTEENI